MRVRSYGAEPASILYNYYSSSDVYVSGSVIIVCFYKLFIPKYSLNRTQNFVLYY